MSSNPVALVYDRGAPVAADQFGAMIGHSRSDERVVGSATTHRSVRQRRQEVPVSSGGSNITSTHIVSARRRTSVAPLMHLHQPGRKPITRYRPLPVGPRRLTA